MLEEPEDRLGMTEEQWETFKRLTRGFPHQDENGVDLSLIHENLNRTPEERLQEHERALKMAEEVERAAIEAGVRRPHPPAKR
jgi:hypothetical protein